MRNVFKVVLALLLAIAVVPLKNADAKDPGFDPFEKSIDQIYEALNSGQTTSEQLVDYYWPASRRTIRTVLT